MEEWKNLAGLAEGNSRLILAFGVAFVGPLRLIAPIEPVAFQLTGPGATAKTIIGRDGNTAYAIPLDHLRAVVAKYSRSAGSR